MAEVERGRLDGHAPVVSTDEIGAVAEGFNRMVHGLRERELVKETFGKYVTPEIRDEILAGRVASSGESQEVTDPVRRPPRLHPLGRGHRARRRGAGPERVLHRDGRGHPRPPRPRAAVHRRRDRGGVRRARRRRRDHAAMAVRAALEMRRRLARLERAPRGRGKPELRHGIGIHTGTVLAGNIGGAERLSYALVGDPVNLASRIQGLNKDFGVDILSARPRARASTAAVDARGAARGAREGPRRGSERLQGGVRRPPLTLPSPRRGEGERSGGGSRGRGRVGRAAPGSDAARYRRTGRPQAREAGLHVG